MFLPESPLSRGQRSSLSPCAQRFSCVSRHFSGFQGPRRGVLLRSMPVGCKIFLAPNLLGGVCLFVFAQGEYTVCPSDTVFV